MCCHVGDGLGHGRRHVRARVKLQLHQARALNGLGFHMLDAGDVQEMILVVVSEVALHLGRVHAAERLRDVDGGNAERWKDVAAHAL